MLTLRLSFLNNSVSNQFFAFYNLHIIPNNILLLSIYLALRSMVDVLVGFLLGNYLKHIHAYIECPLLNAVLLEYKVRTVL